MFDNGSFLRRRKRYKRANLSQGMQFPAVFGPFAPFWVRKPVPVLPVQFGNQTFPQFRDNFDVFGPRSELFVGRNDIIDPKLSVFGNNTGDVIKPEAIDNREKLEIFRRNMDSFGRSSESALDVFGRANLFHKNSEVFEQFGQNSFVRQSENGKLPEKCDLYGECSDTYENERKSFNCDDESNDKIDVESESDEYTTSDIFKRKSEENENLRIKNSFYSEKLFRRQFETADNQNHSPLTEKANSIVERILIKENDLNTVKQLKKFTHKIDELSKEECLSDNKKRRVDSYSTDHAVYSYHGRCPSTSSEQASDDDRPSENVKDFPLEKQSIYLAEMDRRKFEETTILGFDFLNKKRKYANAKGFSIENLIGRNVEEG